MKDNIHDNVAQTATSISKSNNQQNQYRVLIEK